MRSIAEEVTDRLDRLEVPFNAHGLDRYGISKERLSTVGVAFGTLYRSYFSVKCHGTENVPSRGRAMLVANHSGGYAVDASMLAAACFFDLEPPRLAHGMVERFMSRIPFVADWASRVGQFPGLPEHARRLLNDERMLMVFPEGTRGTAKLYKQRHELVRFGTGFMRLALETRTPIVPVAILGGGEAVPTIKNVRWLGKLLGLPYVPLTPYLLAFPLPANIVIHFGKPLLFEGSGMETDNVIDAHVERVKGSIRELLTAGALEYRVR
ncbi:MAG: hypothetical protein RJA70_2038 [Pseudomonadota bacterium]